MIQLLVALCALVVLPVILALEWALVSSLWHDLSQHPVMYWTFIGFVIVFGPIFLIGGFNDYRRWRRKQLQIAAAKKTAKA